jgi:hypothetical protein
MQPINFTERRKKLAGFVSLYLTSVVLLLLIIPAFRNQSPAKTVAYRTPSVKNTQRLIKTTDEIRPMEEVTAPIPADTVTATEELKTLELKNKLLEKENRIIDLENELAAARLKAPVITAPVTSSGNLLQEENNSLKQQLEDQQGKNAGLQNQLSALKRENNNLSLQLTQANSNTTAAASNTEALKNRHTELERRVLEQNILLSFVQVDCNLARVDARQVISNARQRKELLTETLGILNNLATAPDAATQKKIKEKTAQLHKIASTIRD